MSSWKTEHKVHGRDRQLHRLDQLQRVPGTVGVQVGATSTTGSVRRVKGGQANASRSAGENVMVLRAQAKLGRDVAFLSPQEQTEAAQLWRAAFRRAWDSPGNAASAVMDEARKLGQLMVRWFRQHLERGEGRKGALRPVTAATQKRKDREVGPGKGPLERTGQLLRSLTSRVVKR